MILVSTDTIYVQIIRMHHLLHFFPQIVRQSGYARVYTTAECVSSLHVPADYLEALLNQLQNQIVSDF